jgi:hypothetical protein
MLHCTARIPMLATAPRLVVSALLTVMLAPLSAAELRTVPTFENCGLYLEHTTLTPEQIQVRYRESGTTAWLSGHALVVSANDAVPRGSLFALRAGTAYEVECRDTAGTVLANTTFSTWSEDVPIARTVNLAAAGKFPLVISDSGTAAGWVRYVTEQPLDGGEQAESAIVVQGAAFVILDGLTVRGGMRHGIRITNSHDVRIRDCDIAGFSRIGTQDLTKDGKYYTADGKPINNDAGVCIDNSGRTVVERTWIHDPRGHANSWYYSHPAGPNALFVHATGEIVVRWNDFPGSDRHRWNDVIEGWGNGKVDGGFNRDSDIYGNYLAFSNDDGIELDGGQCNVRYYGNVIQGSMCGISTAPNLRGPSWVFGNLVANLADERGLGAAGVKNGGGSTSSLGHTFFYHNTFFGAGNGIANVGYGNDSNRGMFRGTSRNNLFALTGDGLIDRYLPAGNTYDHDLFAQPWAAPGTNDVSGTVETHGVSAAAALTDPTNGDYRPTDNSPARGTGEAIPGFGFLQVDGRADIGALPAGLVSRRLPWRPGYLDATPSEVHFRGLLADARAKPLTVTISTTSISSPQTYTIRMASACDWLHVEPANGSIEPGKPLALSVSLDQRILEHRGSAVGAFLVHLASGASVPVTVSADVATSALRIAAEAETLTGAEGFVAASDAAASGGRYLTFANPGEAKELGAQRLTMPFTVAEDGWYAIALRLRCPRPIPNHDSLYLGIDDAKPEPSPIAGGTNWQWVDRTSPTGVRVHLTKGAHSLVLAPRETLDLDAVQVLDSPLPLSERGAALTGGGR